MINAAGLALIKRFEGCKLTAYLCPAGVPTIGYGHTGPSVKVGQTISQHQADVILESDLAKFEAAIDSHGLALTENQRGALVAFAFNVGAGAFAKSTLLVKLRSGDVSAEDEFLKWNRAGGIVLAGLTKRRLAERELFCA